MSTKHKRGKLRADKIAYPDGIGCCVWYPWPADTNDPEEEDSGICFDFSFEDIDDMIALLQDLKTAEPDIYRDNDASN